MPVEVKVDLAPLERMAARAADGTANEALTERVMEDDYETVPFRTGMLRDSHTVTGKDEFQYTEHYASYVYHGTSRQAANPWFERTKGYFQGEWEEFAARQILGE